MSEVLLWWPQRIAQPYRSSDAPRGRNGAIEYFYGKIGEVTKTRRTLIVPNQAIATYVTRWTYDSHNRLVEMIYIRDEEKITYSYNLGGLLEKSVAKSLRLYDYITKVGVI